MKLTENLQRAINTASKLHSGQFCKIDKSLPYISHPFSVAIILSKYTSSEKILVAGMMHESIEDASGYRYTDLVNEFGFDVANIVRDISDFKDSQADKKSTWFDRKKRYLDKISDAGKEALIVSAADKIHNLQTLIDYYRRYGDEVFDNFTVSIDKKLWFYDAVLAEIRKKLDNPIIVELTSIFKEVKMALSSSTAVRMVS